MGDKNPNKLKKKKKPVDKTTAQPVTDTEITITKNQKTKK